LIDSSGIATSDNSRSLLIGSGLSSSGSGGAVHGSVGSGTFVGGSLVLSSGSSSGASGRQLSLFHLVIVQLPAYQRVIRW
jgi:hypothetical protein